ncbi:MAG: T9SS type A sorting domain-containing protein, partial [Bacteroidetes bacterium]|nr:T9SS type A sorting domain-containing protein [Bacteroidota bacterium]
GSTDSFYVVYNSGSYWVELTDSNGCKAVSDVYTITIENPPVDNITLNANLLISNVSGYNYQWYYNGLPIPGANQQFHLAQNTGNYYVVLSNDIGCSTQSNTLFYQLTGINFKSSIFNYQLKVYPNPNDGSFILSYQLSEPEEILLRVKDMLGRSLYFQKFPKSSGEIQHNIELQDYPSGIYFVEIQTEKVSKTVKVAIK